MGLQALRGLVGEWSATAGDLEAGRDFAQRFEGTFSADGDTIEGRWETSKDGGSTWELDFPLTYTRVP